MKTQHTFYIYYKSHGLWSFKELSAKGAKNIHLPICTDWYLFLYRNWIKLCIDPSLLNSINMLSEMLGPALLCSMNKPIGNDKCKQYYLNYNSTYVTKLFWINNLISVLTSREQIIYQHWFNVNYVQSILGPFQPFPSTLVGLNNNWLWDLWMSLNFMINARTYQLALRIQLF